MCAFRGPEERIVIEAVHQPVRDDEALRRIALVAQHEPVKQGLAGALTVAVGWLRECLFVLVVCIQDDEVRVGHPALKDRLDEGRHRAALAGNGIPQNRRMLAEESIEIKSIAREPGNRTKVAAASKAEGVDPVGALVGQRGTRVMAVNNELGNEKIDIAEWSDDPEKFIANALSPAKVEKVEILPRREARAYVPENQLSLA